MKRSLRDAAATTTLWLGLASGCEVVLSFVILVVLARRLPPESFGIVALSLAAIKTFTGFNRELFLQAVIQHDDLSERHFSSIFWSGAVFGLLCAAMVWLLSPPLAKFFNSLEMVDTINALAILPLISGLEAILEAQAQRNFEGKRLGMALVAGRMAGGIAGVVLAMTGMGVWSLVIQQNSSSGCSVRSDARDHAEIADDRLFMVACKGIACLWCEDSARPPSGYVADAHLCCPMWPLFRHPTRG